MTTKIQKWGNSLGIRIPKSFLDSGEITEGTTFTLTQKGEEIILKKVSKPKLTLKDVMRGIKREDMHPLILPQGFVGKEIID